MQEFTNLMLQINSKLDTSSQDFIRCENDKSILNLSQHVKNRDVDGTMNFVPILVTNICNIIYFYNEYPFKTFMNIFECKLQKVIEGITNYASNDKKVFKRIFKKGFQKILYFTIAV